LGKPQTSTSTLNAIKMKPSVMVAISVMDAVPDSFLRKRVLDIGAGNGAVLPKKGVQLTAGAGARSLGGVLHHE
jgi:hypothetical protein